MDCDKYLIIIHPHFTIPGGAGQVILELGKRLAPESRVIVVAQKILPEYQDKYPEIKFESLEGPVTSSFKFWLLLPYWRYRTKKVIDQYAKKGKVAVLCNSFPANWIGLSLRNAYKETPFFWYCHEPSAFIHIKRLRQSIKSPFKRLIANTLAPVFAVIDKRLIAKADEIFVNSDYTRERVKEVYGLETEVIYPGVNTELFKPIAGAGKQDLIVSAGLLAKYKGFDLLVRAFSEIENKKIRLCIIGDGEEKESLESIARELGISSRVEFISAVPQVKLAEYFRQAKLIVSCSKNETFGLVLVEALASGTPVISDDSGGPKEIVRNGINGELIKCDKDILATTLNRLLIDETQLAKYALAARESVLEKFNWDNSAVKLKNIIKREGR